MPKFFDEILSKYQCGFRKAFNSQHCSAAVRKMARKMAINYRQRSIGAFLTDLSEAFDCILHDLLIAKLHAYDVDMKCLSFLDSYLDSSKQSNDNYSSFEEIVFGVHQGSVVGPLLVFVSDLFLILNNIEIAK